MVLHAHRFSLSVPAETHQACKEVTRQRTSKFGPGFLNCSLVHECSTSLQRTSIAEGQGRFGLMHRKSPISGDQGVQPVGSATEIALIIKLATTKSDIQSTWQFLFPRSYDLCQQLLCAPYLSITSHGTLEVQSLSSVLPLPNMALRQQAASEVSWGSARPAAALLLAGSHLLSTEAARGHSFHAMPGKR